MKTKSMSGNHYRQKKVSKPENKAKNRWGNNLNNLFSFAKWWVENNRPTEFTVKLRLINVMGLVLIVLILGMLDNAGHVRVILDYLDGLGKILP